MTFSYKEIGNIFIVHMVVIDLINPLATQKKNEKPKAITGVIKLRDEHNNTLDTFTFSENEIKHENEIKTLLEEKYKFKNDEKSKRFRIANSDREYPVFPEPQSDKKIAWAFRAYASRRIVGGMETSIGVYPYNVAMIRNGKHWCGGCLIDEQWIVSAGHCVEAVIDNDKRRLSSYVIRAGSSYNNRGGYQARVNRVFVNEQGYSPGRADYDWSLVRLDRPMPMGRNIAVVNLPSPTYPVHPGDILIVTGWGSTEPSGEGSIPDRLRFVPVPAISQAECQKAYNFAITDRMVCAGYPTGGKDACNHDSGGPAVRKGVLMGLVSFGGKRCGDPKSPGVYSRASEFSLWVNQMITSNEASEVPELKEKIKKARQREKELQEFKVRVEDKKNKIKSWLRETLKSPSFIELAKQKLRAAGFTVRSETRRMDVISNATMDDDKIDEVNLSNLIHDRIIDETDNESEVILSTLALQEVMMSERADELFPSAGVERINIEDIIETR